jgi:hypothetical protein
MGLFTPAWKSKNKKRALRAVEKITDQIKLARVAKEAWTWEVRKAAVKKLTGQSALADIAKNASNSHVRKAAVEKLTDQNALADIVKNDVDWDVRRAAVERLFASDKLKDVVEYFSNIDISNVKNNASILIPIAKKFPQAMKENWRQIENRVKTLHEDKHDDIACYSERISITAASLGVVFPPYPFND